MKQMPAIADLSHHVSLEDVSRKYQWVRSAPFMIYAIGPDSRIISVSDRWLQRTGYDWHDIAGIRSSEILGPSVRLGSAANVLPDFFRNGSMEKSEFQILCKNGDIITVLVSAVIDRSDPDMTVSLGFITEPNDADRHLIESEAKYRSIVEDQTELVGLASPDLTLRFVNNACARHYGGEPAEMMHRNLLDFVPEASRPQLIEQMNRAMGSTEALTNENEICLTDGTTRWIAWTNRAIRGRDGEVLWIHFVGRDVDDRKRAELRLTESESRYRMLAENSTDLVFHLDSNLIWKYASPACREILGYDADAKIGTRALGALHPEDSEKTRSAFEDIANGRLARGTLSYRSRHADGHWLWVQAALRAAWDPVTGAPSGLVGSLRDITAQKEVEQKLADANRRLEILAGQDGLTQIYNRRTFDETLAREIRLARRKGWTLSLLMIDVDTFKAYNDTYGHPAGDAALRRISMVISMSIKRPTDLAARYGGEEFAVLLPDTDTPGAVAVAELIRSNVESLGIEHSAGAWPKVTVSIGVGSAHNAAPDGMKTDALLNAADRALYQAKSGGRNRLAVWTGSSDDPWRVPRAAIARQSHDPPVA